jgi:OHCU decarboxylase
MANERPFGSLERLMLEAETIWWSLMPEDWLEAFRSHPKIGERKAAEQTSAEAQRWSEQEQSGTRTASLDTMQVLAELNSKYEEKFGYIFIVCATGRSSEEMLALLRERLNNDPENELRIAAEEQSRITKLRLRKLVDQ